MSEAHTEYTRRREARRCEAEDLKVRERRIGVARLGLFVGALVIAWLASVAAAIALLTLSGAAIDAVHKLF